LGGDALQVFWLGTFHVMHAPVRPGSLQVVNETMSLTERPSSGMGTAALRARAARMGRRAVGARKRMVALE
jgi:hypothetical protein